MEMDAKIRITLLKDGVERFYGPGVQDLLNGIHEHGSVKDACAAMDLSYSKGRRILKHAEAALGYPLVVRQQGGLTGGSATLTPQAEAFIARYRRLTEAVSDYAKKQLQEIF